MHHHRLAIRNPTLEAAGAVAQVAEALTLDIDRRVVHPRTRECRYLEADADGNRLAGGDAHHGLGQQPVKPRVPLPGATRSGWNPARDHRGPATHGLAR